VLVKRAEETGEHVQQKALLWLRYLPAYPTLRVEQALPFPSRFKPDLYALDATEQGVAFWGECGVVSAEKLGRLLRAHPAAHFAFSKWEGRVGAFAAQVDAALRDVRRCAPVELLVFPREAAGWLDVDDPATTAAHLDEIEVRRWMP
jgi:hypothetical protein